MKEVCEYYCRNNRNYNIISTPIQNYTCKLNVNMRFYVHKLNIYKQLLYVNAQIENSIKMCYLLLNLYLEK